MGGNAFPRVSTPRMPADTYVILKTRIHHALQKYFFHVATPIEAAGKKDFGDVDVMVCEPMRYAMGLQEAVPIEWRYDLTAIGSVIGAVNGKRVGRTDNFHFVVPWPKDLRPPASHLCSVIDDVQSSAVEDSIKHHVQVDIEICHNIEDLNWLKFLHAHGDFWNITRCMLRKFSITATPKGLFFVVPEAAGQPKTSSRVFATRDPDVALSYLGLDQKRFWQPFEAWEDVCDFAATCRFHDPGRNRQGYEQSTTPSNVGTPQNGLTSTASSYNTVPDVLDGLNLTKADRSNVKKRPLLSYWLDVYRPSHLNDVPGVTSQLSREQVLEDAKIFFGPDFAARYENQKYEGTRFAFESKLWAETRKFVKEAAKGSSEVTMATKGLKRALLEDPDESDWIEIHNLADLRRLYNTMNMDGIMGWWRKNWTMLEIQQREFERIKSASASAYKATKGKKGAAGA